MDVPADRRRHPRLSVDPSYTARFKAANRTFTGVPMTDLSAGGTCLRMAPAEAAGLVKGTNVVSLFLDHLGLPTVPLQGQVAWVMGRVPGRTEGFVLIGVEFVNLHAKVEAALAHYVRQRLGASAQP